MSKIIGDPTIFGGGGPTVGAIHIGSYADKLIYDPGETFDPTGMTVIADYIDKNGNVIASGEVTDWTYAPTTALSEGGSVTVSYDGLTADAGVDCCKALRFWSAEPFTLNVRDKQKHWDGVIEYSTNLSTWTQWNGETIASGMGGKLFMRGSGNTIITAAMTQDTSWSLQGAKIRCDGNIEMLRGYQTYGTNQHPVMSDRCYSFMFTNCTSLLTAPALPATTLADRCYYCMFSSCLSLFTAPALPATTLVQFCYGYMFKTCRSLLTAPALPATTLAQSCYQNMFKTCRSLLAAPALPATTLAQSCYAGMLQGCISLKFSASQTGEYIYPYRIPTSGTGATVSGALTNMFTNTGGTFTGTPTINTTYYTTDAPAGSGLENLRFSSPNSFTLKTANSAKNWDGTLEYDNGSGWTIWDGTSAISSNSNGSLTLRGTGNTKITGGDDKRWILTGSNIHCDGNIETLLDYATVIAGNHPTMADNCYQNMFNGCTSLTSAPALPATTLKNYCYACMFQNCTSLTTAPALPTTTLASSCYYYMFNGCTSLTSAPALPATTLVDSCYASMFSGCTSLTTAPALPATTLASNCYASMFKSCASLTTAPALSVTTLAEYCYYNMFNGCTSLTSAPTLHATTLVDGCYWAMFQGCTSLTSVPALPATTLKQFCYMSMFKDCTSLKLSASQAGEYIYPYRIPTSGEGTTASSALSSMFTNTGGTFTGTPTINTTYYTDHKPVGTINWTAEQAAEYYTYTVANNKITITGMSERARLYGDNITEMPDAIDGKPITAISNNAFEMTVTIGGQTGTACPGLQLTSLPAGLTSIGQRAFIGCFNLALTSLPDGVTSIGNEAFFDCRSLNITTVPCAYGTNAFKGTRCENPSIE